MKQLGFDESIDYSSEKSIFSAEGLEVEFLAPRTAKSKHQKKSIQKELRVTPEALPCVDLLTDNSEEFKIHGVGKVILPSVEAFILHKLLILPDRKNEAKRLKDIFQVLTLVDFVMRDPKRREHLHSIFKEFIGSWQKRIIKVVGQLAKDMDDPRQKKILEQFSDVM